MKIDICCHLIPPKLKDIMFEKQKTIRELRTNVCLFDLDERFRLMDRYPDLIQVLSVPGATPDDLAGAKGRSASPRESTTSWPNWSASIPGVLRAPWRFFPPATSTPRSAKSTERSMN